ncbi:glycosyltransferase [Sciscionella sediminilitoris]|uniref:glycosyltransferase n=1 Tax=Sciscionella sediminilitoris TaxID=1445613 RepID=UPI0004DF70E8|nr:glycosyltransferase [Sciscionella sp. SE31]
MRVAHVITGLGVGGAETQLRLQLRHTAHEAEVFTLTNPGPIAEQLRSDGIPVTTLGMRGNRDLAVLPRLARLLRDGRFDVVHTHLYRAMLYGRLAARFAGIRTILGTEHSLAGGLLEGRPAGRPGIRAVYRFGERLGSLTIAVSPAVADRLREWGVAAHRMRVIPNGIDAGELAFDPDRRARARARLGIGTGAFVLGAVGRLVPGKRFDVLIETLPMVGDATLILVGDGPERANLSALAERRGVAERVVFAGETERVRDFLSAFDMLASPSAEETFGLAVLEALAAGLPVIYQHCPALQEQRGIELAAAVRINCTPENLRAAIGKLRAGKHDREPAAVVARYDIRRVSGEIDGLYRELSGLRSEPVVA